MFRNSTVTRGPWSVGSTSGHGIDGEILSICRHLRLPSGRYAMMRHQLDGMPFQGTRDERNRLLCLHGVLQPYNRNLCQFVMSRAARKRGVKTTDWMYLARKARKEIA